MDQNQTIDLKHALFVLSWQEKKRTRYFYAEDHVKFISQKKTYIFFYMHSDFCERKKGQLKTNNACFKSIVWLPTTFKIFGFPIFWQWAYRMKVTPETRRTQEFRYLMLLVLVLFSRLGMKGQLKTNNACFKSIVWFWSILFVNDLFHFFLEILYHTKSRKQN
jgi:hypothetical protein